MRKVNKFSKQDVPFNQNDGLINGTNYLIIRKTKKLYKALKGFTYDDAEYYRLHYYNLNEIIVLNARKK